MEGMDVGPHPHTGLATLTFMLSGANVHRDSIGSEVVTLAGDVSSIYSDLSFLFTLLLCVKNCVFMCVQVVMCAINLV
jgi:hypothetical protein